MRLMKWMLVFALAVCGVRHGEAQARPTATGPGIALTVGGGYAAYQVQYGQRVDYGTMAFADFHASGRWGVEAEGRWLHWHTDEGVTQATYLVGPHVYLSRRGLVHTYAKLLVGDAHMQFPFGYASGDYFVLAPGAGVDLHVAPRVDVRLLDIERQTWPQFSYGPLHPYGISAGVHFRLTRSNVFRNDPYVN